MMYVGNSLGGEQQLRRHKINIYPQISWEIGGGGGGGGVRNIKQAYGHK
jgi:hypothetical protein